MEGKIYYQKEQPLSNYLNYRSTFRVLVFKAVKEANKILPVGCDHKFSFGKPLINVLKILFVTTF